MKNVLALTLLALTLFSSCKKSDSPSNNQPTCSALVSVKAKASETTIGKGSTLHYSADLSFSGTANSAISYTWTIPGVGSNIKASDSLVSVDYKHAGWWYLEVKNTCDGTIKKDSFNLTVTIAQGTPPCIADAKDSILNFTGFLTGDVKFSNTKIQNKAFTNAGIDYFGIQADQPTVPGYTEFGTLVIIFPTQYNLANLPSTGIYNTSAVGSDGFPTFGANDFDKCYITYIAYSPRAGIVGYKSIPGQNVYITNQNGKLKAVLCNVTVSGTANGVTYTTAASGTLVVP